MKTKKTQTILHAGERDIPVTVTRKKMKNLRLRVTPSGEVAVSAPYLTSRADVERFIAANEAWILKRLASTPAPATYADGTTVIILGEPLTLRVRAAKKKSARLDGGVLALELPKPDAPDAIKKLFVEWKRAAAVKYFSARIDALFPPFAAGGLTQPELTVKKMTSRWGSCNKKERKIALSTFLFSAPPDCVDYVVAHELCHLVHGGHGKEFHALLCAVMPDCETRRKKLNALSRTLITD